MHKQIQTLRNCAALICMCLGMHVFAQDAVPAAADTPAEDSAAMRRHSAKEVLRIAIPGNIFARVEKGVPTGIFIETMDAVLKKMGKAPTYVNMPTGEALNELKSGTIGAAAVVVQTPRIKDSAYFSDPIVKEYNIAVTLKGKAFSLSKISDLYGKKVGARVGYQYPLVEKAQQIELLRYQTDAEMMRSLLFGETDLVLIAGISAISTFRSEGIMTRLEMLKTSVGVVPLVVAFSKDRFTKEIVDTFNLELAKFMKSDEWENILESNGLADLVKDWPMIAQ
jgi:ABC-type amino acid transport substrate-binding protein